MDGGRGLKQLVTFLPNKIRRVLNARAKFNSSFLYTSLSCQISSSCVYLNAPHLRIFPWTGLCLGIFCLCDRKKIEVLCLKHRNILISRYFQEYIDCKVTEVFENIFFFFNIWVLFLSLLSWGLCGSIEFTGSAMIIYKVSLEVLSVYLLSLFPVGLCIMIQVETSKRNLLSGLFAHGLKVS